MFCDHVTKCVPVSLHKLLSKCETRPTAWAARALILVTKNAGNRRSWKLIFQNFPEEHFPGPQWQIKEGGLWSVTHPFLSDFFFYKNEVYEQKASAKRVRKCWKMAILETQIIFKNFWGGMPPDLPGKLAPTALVLPPPPPPPLVILKVLDLPLDP